MPLPQISSVLIFDFGDVLFSWSKKTSSSIAPRTLKAILSSPTWQDFERAHISQHDCYERIGREFSVSPSQVKLAFDDARNSLRSNDEMISFLRELKSESKGQLKVYAMSNISHSDYEFLKSIPTDWSLFDKVYTSAEAGERKPNLGFYRHVLADIGTEPQAVVFVDDKPENVLSARSFGMTGIVFDDQKRVMRAVRNAVQDPIERGRKFLQEHAGCLDSVTNNGIILKENFAQLLILEATGDRRVESIFGWQTLCLLILGPFSSNLVRLIEHDRAWNFFQGTPVLTTEEFPCDLDTTSLALTVTRQSTNVISSMMDEMLEYLDKDGIVQVCNYS
jgi:HAD superfamily hydrolase (TIGR01509 family)